MLASTLMSAVLNLSTLYSIHILELPFVRTSGINKIIMDIHMYVCILVIEDTPSKLSYHIILHPLAIS